MLDLAPFLRRRDDGRPRLMGIVNVTPDSFHADSRAESVERAVELALQHWAEGADWVDVGGESTRPGAEPVSIEEEMARVIPVVEALSKANPDGLISIDTRHHEVARMALTAGAHMINDVSGLRDIEMQQLVVDSGCAVCIMHMLGEPGNMQDKPTYDDVVAEVSENLHQIALTLVSKGHDEKLLTLDPGIGFGKSLEHNLTLLRGNGSLAMNGRFSTLWGVSRKSMFRDLLGNQETSQRLPGTLGVAAHALLEGVDLLRVHDVKEHADLLRTMVELR